MLTERYFGTYARFETISKREAAPLLGADNLVGDEFSIDFQIEDGTSIAWLKNRFGAVIGRLDSTLSRQLKILDARGWRLQAYLSFVAFTDEPKPGHYWGEVAIICYEPQYEHTFSLFSTQAASKLAAGVRPDITLGEQGVDQVISSEGSWFPKQRVPFPAQSEGTVIIKSHRGLTEKLIEQSRKGNKGCYVASWVFLLLLIALLIFGLKACGVF
ncbi:hypothetical protein [Eggerthella sp. YY7918]|uniref:hypothetical protein n=1 Tax=Eggerthella sp. (strain YY7918) TaxID=502558 RepID=UPI00021715D0|nr:hypothetical protein [Eggerthella sp. YY7918]BAK45954.1 hypothetical protein EGYY_29900 [Eggerthella sp. YY7918]